MQDAGKHTGRVQERLCAVIVTFHPDSAMLDRLNALASQADGLVVVDNGSSDAELDPIRSLFSLQAHTAALLEQGDNLGIATALNLGVRWAAAHQFTHVLLFDQDSRITPGFFAAMQSCWTAHARSNGWGSRLALLAPVYRDSRLGVPILQNRAREGLEAAMTSGSMLAVDLFTRIGYFRDELFIDGVDYEFSLRARTAGLILAECPDAVLEHSPGEPRVIRFRGRRLYQTANYSPQRRYYQERNKIWISRRYFRRFPVFCAKLFLFSLKDFIKILVAEPDSARKARFFLRGLRDGLREQMGRLK